MTIVAAAALLLTASCTQKENNEKVNIQKQTVKLESDQMTPEALWAMSRLGGYQASPDGLHIVFQTGYYSVEENASHQVLWMMKADGSEQKQLTTDADNETDAQWLDNETIAFLRGGEVWSMDLEGNARKQLSNSEGSIEGFMFSPDRSKVILLKSIDFNDIIKAKPADLPKTTGRVVTDLMYRHWDHYVETIQHPFVAEVNSQFSIHDSHIDILEGEPFECPMEPFGGMAQLAWSPDSKQIAYTCRKKTGLAYSISTDSDIFLYDVEKKETTNLCKPADYVEPAIEPSKTMLHQAVNAPENLKNLPGYDQNPKFSPDGRYITWLSMARNGYEADRMRLCCHDLQSGEKTFLTESFDSNVDDYCWTPDSKTIYFIGVWHATENLYSTNLQGEVKQITNFQADFGSLQMLNDKQILAGKHSFTEPADLYVVTPSDPNYGVTIAQITEINKDILDQLGRPSVDQRWVKTTDGQQMLYWIIQPPHFDPNKKYPTLLFCEGGPQSPVSQFWSYRWNFFIMASQGYVIVAPNRRGLPGFGQEWLEEISGDWTGQCMHDYLAAIDFACDELPYVDRDGCRVEVTQKLVSIYDTNGKLLRQESITDYTKSNILGRYASLENFIRQWSAEDKKAAIRDLLRITKKHREKQIAWNKAHHITPKSVKRAINESVYVYSEAKKTERAAANETPETYDVRETIAALQEEMLQAADALEFERAAYLRDQIKALKAIK